ncbi:unnamed protein product [Musa acuminata subsp. malaccensis]|uniref:Hexosyltransferase n=1 Tax=Musa acuminata subsp. malaccensis TaxID=214687 RepID=A0A804I883_MUSAM|nr:PREDICTED: probable galacturonosyltransferase 4 isoform X1 [Musa acuminata subsp. malaccensis]XP_018678742.1 PREDICTED: probable galacturonosyltransferase 4 isoform X1 [Musa acuminata subsp. malaccensis]CAG1849102.1 unnamed protein product [Musa acuminata subsp. malaccensis]
MVGRKLVLFLLCISVVAPIVLYTDPLATQPSYLADIHLGDEIPTLKSVDAVREPSGIVYPENSTNPDQISVHDSGRAVASNTTTLPSGKNGDRKNRVLSQDNNQTAPSETDDGAVIRQVTSRETSEGATAMESQTVLPTQSRNQQKPGKRSKRDSGRMPDAKIQQFRDQLMKAKVSLGLSSSKSNPEFIRELKERVKDVERTLAYATEDTELPINAQEKLEAMEQTLAKGKQTQQDCCAVVKKLRRFYLSAEEQLRVHKKRELFLTQVAAKTLPRGLHCLSLRLTTDYYSLDSCQQQLPNRDKLENPRLYHYALFSDNVLATAVVVNSTVFHAKDPQSHVFHIVTDKLNYAAMKMWFLANPPAKATVQVQNVEEFTWLNSSYSPVLKQLASRSMIDYYFRSQHAKSDQNLKFRNPKYLSIMNHLRFYLPEIFPKLNKVVFLDDDVVVQKDLTPLWAIDLKGKVNGAVETCGESFHRFDRYLNFSNPLIAETFDPHACGWAYGMNVFDLDEWKKQNITDVYHHWQNLNDDRQLWKLGTLPAGLITFWNSTYPLERSWHVLGLGYSLNVEQKDVEAAAVIHYNGNLKPWLEIGMTKYRNFWSNYVDYNQAYLRDCNINP